jgi:acetyl esterase/lipase
VHPPQYQVLIYPVTDYAFDTASYIENVKAKPLNAATMKWFFEKYLNSPKDGENRWISLGNVSSLREQPPATVITADIDPLRTEGKTYADRLRQTGVKVDYKNYEGMTHEFFGTGAVVDKAKAAVAQAAAGLQSAFTDVKPQGNRP